MGPRNGVDGFLIAFVSAFAYWLNSGAWDVTFVSLIACAGIVSGVFFVARAIRTRIVSASDSVEITPRTGI